MSPARCVTTLVTVAGLAAAATLQTGQQLGLTSALQHRNTAPPPAVAAPRSAAAMSRKIWKPSHNYWSKPNIACFVIKFLC